MWLQAQEVAQVIGEADNGVGMLIALVAASVTAIMVLLDRFVYMLTKWGVIRHRNGKVQPPTTIASLSGETPPEGPSTADYHELLKRAIASSEKQSRSMDLLIMTLQEMQSSGNLRDIEMAKQTDMLGHLMAAG